MPPSAFEDSAGQFVILNLMCFGFVALVSIGLLAFWIWMLVDCLQNTPSDDNQKLIWVLVIVLASWLGALIYFFVQRPKNRAGPM
jgi:hypothetical protein